MEEELPRIKVLGLTITLHYEETEGEGADYSQTKQVIENYLRNEKEDLVDSILDAISQDEDDCFDRQRMIDRFLVVFEREGDHSQAIHFEMLHSNMDRLTEMFQANPNESVSDRIKRYEVNLSEMTNVQDSIKSETIKLKERVKSLQRQQQLAKHVLADKMKKLQEVKKELADVAGEKEHKKRVEMLDLKKVKLENQIYDLEAKKREKHQQLKQLDDKIRCNENLMKELKEVTYHALGIYNQYPARINTLRQQVMDNQQIIHDSFIYTNNFFIPLIEIVHRIKTIPGLTIRDVEKMIDQYQFQIQNFNPRTGQINLPP